MYQAGLGLVQLDQFEDHDGFDGIMLGLPGSSFHFEFAYRREHPVVPTPTAEDLLVFYIPDPTEWDIRCKAMIDAGFIAIPALNPYWDRNGRTFQDPDGYRVVIQRSSWTQSQAPVTWSK